MIVTTGGSLSLGPHGSVVTLEIVLTPSLDSFTSGFLGLVYRLGFGAGAGLVFGFAIVGVLVALFVGTTGLVAWRLRTAFRGTAHRSMHRP